MAKKSMIQREVKRENAGGKNTQPSARRSKKSQTIESLPMEERFKARLKLAKLPRNSSATRLHNRCQAHRPSARLLP